MGVAYQYNKINHMWKMVRYEKGVKTVLQEEVQSIKEKLPDMVTVEHSLCQFLKDYLAGDYFRQIEMKKTNRKHRKEEKKDDRYSEIGKLVFHKEGENIEMGFRKRKSLNGIGCIFDKGKQQLLQAGFYVDGVPEGYTFTGHGGQHYSIDFYE